VVTNAGGLLLAREAKSAALTALFPLGLVVAPGSGMGHRAVLAVLVSDDATGAWVRTQGGDVVRARIQDNVAVVNGRGVRRMVVRTSSHELRVGI
jgi:hypothetical protein